MAKEMAKYEQQQDDKQMVSTIDIGTDAGKVKAMAIIGENGTAGKDWIPANKPTELEIDDLAFRWREEYEKDDGEIVKAHWQCVCVLRSGDIVTFSSYVVVNFLRAAYSMWRLNWSGIVVRVTKSSGRTKYKIEYVREGDWRD